MRILLINPPYIGWLNDLKVEPIGLLYIAAHLRACGHEIELYDAYIGETETQFIEQIERWKPQIVACAVYTVSEQFCFDMARLVKAVDPTILYVAGGPHATFTPARMSTRCQEIDVITIRESEETMADLAACVEEDGDLTAVPGIACRTSAAHPRDSVAHCSDAKVGGLGRRRLPIFEQGAGDEVLITPPRVHRTPIDAYRFPAKDLLSPRYYEKYHATGVITGRGCAYKCDFCVSPAFFKGVRQRRVELVAAELREVMSQRYIRHVRYYDDVFAYNLARMKLVREHIGPLGLTYDCYIRIDVTTPDMLEVMKESGCVQVRFGVETGDESTRSLHKGGRTATFERHARVVEKCRELGIETLASYILGFPNDARDDIMATIDCADRLNTDRVGFYKLTPYPGTVYWDMLDPANVPLHNYTKFDNEVSVNRHMTSAEISDLVRLAYETYYRNRQIPYENPDALRFLTSLPKLRY